MLLTATEVTIMSNISASAGTITAQGLIPTVQRSISVLTNNYFPSGLYLRGGMTFNATARTIVADSSFEDENVLAGDTVYVWGSYRNDGFYDVASVDDEKITLADGSVVQDELSGASILVSVVKWPTELKRIAAQMIAYDYDDRKNEKGLNSRSLGPLSESYDRTHDSEGYPVAITGVLSRYRMVNIL